MDSYILSCPITWAVNSYWAMILPVTVNAMNMIIMRNFFQALPDSLEESAKMDGCTDFGVFFKNHVAFSFTIYRNDFFILRCFLLECVHDNNLVYQ